MMTLPATIICLFSESVLCFGKDYIAAGCVAYFDDWSRYLFGFGAVPVYLNMTGRQHIFQIILVLAVVVNFVLNRFFNTRLWDDRSGNCFCCKFVFGMVQQ
jgi:hypothetical protein